MGRSSVPKYLVPTLRRRIILAFGIDVLAGLAVGREIYIQSPQVDHMIEVGVAALLHLRVLGVRE